MPSFSSLLDTLRRDVHYARRRLMRQPILALGITGTLALGLGANAAIFGVADAVLLRDLPYRASDRLYMVWETGPRASMERTTVSVPDFLDWRASSTSFEDMAAYAETGINVQLGARAERVQAQVVSASFFPLLGATPVAGRTFTAQEDDSGYGSVVVVSHGFWQRQLGGDPAAVGRALSIGGEPYTVIGIMNADFRFPGDAQLWLPLATYTGNMRIWRATHVLTVVGRMRPELPSARAEQELTILAHRFWSESASLWNGWRVTVTPLREQLYGEIRSLVVFLWLAGALVFGVMCANVANLFLAAGVARRRELAVRAALGAGWRGLVLQLVTEVLMLAILGGMSGLLVAFALLSGLSASLPASVTAVHELALNGRVTAYAAGCCLLAALVFGLAPAFNTAGAGIAAVARDGGRSGMGIGFARLRVGLVASQIALSLTLLISTLLVVRSFAALRAVDAGFRTENLVTFRVSLTGSDYAQPGQRAALFRRIETQLASEPGVSAVGVGSRVPFASARSFAGASIFVEGRTPLPSDEQPIADVSSVSAGYFEALGLRAQQGRTLTGADDADAPRVAVINRAAAQLLWPNQDPLGARIRTGVDENTYTVVGVIPDVKPGDLREPAKPEVHLPAPQWPVRTQIFIVRTALPLTALAPALRAAVTEADPDLPSYDLNELTYYVDQSLASSVLATRVLGGLSFLAIALAGVGIYAVTAFLVGMRKRELSLRMALGARPRDILLLVLREGALIGTLGVIGGVLAAAAAARLLAHQLFEISATDPMTYILASAFLACAAVLATLAPARRAARIDPAEMLRV